MIAFYYPFTFSGTVFFLGSLLLLGRSYATRNPYGTLISIIILFALLFLAILARVQAVRFAKLQFQWDTSGSIYAGRTEISHRLITPKRGTFYFFRIHFALKGKLFAARNAPFLVYKEFSADGTEDIALPLIFPFSGTLKAKADLMVRDIAGLTRAKFKIEEERAIPIRPPMVDSRKFTSNSTGGFETKNRQKSSDEEKYYMREYIPGDRARDINWKASSRFEEIFTRISPVTQEKTKIVHVDFRHFRKDDTPTLEAVVQLDYLKRMLLSFLWRIKGDHPEYVFRLSTGRGIHELETEEDIKRFSMELSGIFYEPDPGRVQEPSGADELFIFTTPYDYQLPRLLSFYAGKKIHLFRTVLTGERGNGEDQVNITVLPTIETICIPGFWALRREREQGGKGHPGRVNGTIFNEKLGIKLV
ncbi:MAG: hypothetical protein DRP87_10885 [Spirochaetes bacterium]|nr:MAG: hypothetical protein DRP87_10885 [Spirochaetota bacterium]